VISRSESGPLAGSTGACVLLVGSSAVGPSMAGVNST
jgi:hypothetical protein